MNVAEFFKCLHQLDPQLAKKLLEEILSKRMAETITAFVKISTVRFYIQNGSIPTNDELLLAMREFEKEIEEMLLDGAFNSTLNEIRDPAIFNNGLNS